MPQSGRTVFQRHRTRGATEQTVAKTISEDTQIVTQSRSTVSPWQ